MKHAGDGVSVVIPCFRCGSTIERALTSVYQQTLPAAEIIIVDDASGDGTLDVLREFQRTFESGWIRIVEQRKNTGPGAARNAGWETATQPFVAFLDADDAWHPQKLEIQLQWMQSHPDVTLSGHRSVVARANQGTRPNSLTLTQWRARRIQPRQLLLSNCFPTRSVMLRRSTSLRFDPSKRYSEDYSLWLQLALDGHQLWMLEVPLAFSFKPEFGGGGLTGDLWRMEKGEIAVFHRLFREKRISLAIWLLATCWSLARYVRRLIRTKVRAHRSPRWQTARDD